jgi:hypothetical protein
MRVSIAIAALSALGAKANDGNALKIASSMPTGGLPALAVAGGGQLGGAGTATGVLISPSTGSLGVAGNAMMQADKEEGSGGTQEESGPKIPEGLDKRLTTLVKDVPQRARDGKLLKSSNYHAHFDDATVLQILKDADAIYQSEGKAGRLIFRKGNDIVVVEGPGSGQGSVIPGYGPSGPTPTDRDPGARPPRERLPCRSAGPATSRRGRGSARRRGRGGCRPPIATRCGSQLAATPTCCFITGVMAAGSSVRRSRT